MRRTVKTVTPWLVMAWLVSAGTAAAQTEAWRSGLATRLKQRVDAALARTVRELRAELHREIDAAVAAAGGNELDALLKELESGDATTKPAPATDRTATNEDLQRRYEGLRAKLGPDDPMVKEIRRELEALESGRPGAAEDPWTTIGVIWAPVDEAFRARHALKPGEGRRVEAVVPGSAAATAGFAAGDVVLAFEGPLDSPPCWKTSVIPTGSGERTVRFVRRADFDRVTGLRGDGSDPTIDPKSWIDKALKDAIKQAVPRSEVLPGTVPRVP